MDLLDYDIAEDAERGGVVHLKDPRTGAPLFAPDGRPVTVSFRGIHSPTYQEAQDEARRRLGVVGCLRGTDYFAKRAEAEDLAVLVAVTDDWDGFHLDGEPLAFDEEVAWAVYRRFAWIRDQVRAAVEDPKACPPARSEWRGIPDGEEESPPSSRDRLLQRAAA